MVVPVVEEEHDQGDRVSKRAKADEVQDMDAADVQKLSLSRQAELKRQHHALLSSVVQRGLAIPSMKDTSSLPGGDKAVVEEMMRIVAHDMAKNAAVGAHEKGKKKKKKSTKRGRQEEPEGPVPLDGIAEAELISARREMAKEWNAVEIARVEQLLPSFVESWESLSADCIVLPSGALAQRRNLTPPELLAALKHNFELVRKAAKSRETQCQQLEEKLNVFLGGYATRADSLNKDAQAAFAELEQSRVDRVCFNEMATRESVAATGRLQHLNEELLPMTVLEDNLQAQYQRYLAMSLSKK